MSVSCSKVVTDIEGCGSHVDVKIRLGRLVALASIIMSRFYVSQKQL